jgi:hypothetical protein
MLLAALLLLGSNPDARELPRRVQSTSEALYRVGHVTGRLERVGDFDGDGLDDFVAGCSGVARREDWIDLCSSASGATLRTLWHRGLPSDPAGSWCVGGDLDGDGRGDIAIGTAQADDGKGRVIVLSLADGRLLREVRGERLGEGFGSAVAFVPDVDADGHDELLIGAVEHGATESVRAPGPGFVTLRSGADGRELWHARGAVGGMGFGADVECAGDVDGDRRTELIVQHDRLAGLAPVVLSSVKGEVVRLPLAIDRDAWVRAGGDVDGDGNPEVVFWSVVPRVLTLATGLERMQLPNVDRELPSRWTTVRGVGDLDGDGCTDVALGEPNFNLWGMQHVESKRRPAPDLKRMSLEEAVAAPTFPWCMTPEPGAVHVYSGRSKQPLLVVFGPADSMRGLGGDALVLPDVDGDGAADLLVRDENVAFAMRGPGAR